MPTMIFVNLPVSELERSKAFYSALGFDINPQFSDEKGACVVISDTIYAMIVTKPYFSTFTSKDIADTSTSVAAITALSRDSKADVDAIADKAILAGGIQTNDPQDLGFMYTRSFQDPDGNMWEALWMDPSHVE
ncbi:glyoxalase [Diaminobutyricibacter tongyongensis]|uniref:Glyoxalase n=1 Tax=Leifsonia tongyongensis TaxID=1268043 RepID=A0A6L9Y1D1_9MICO|nr:VOC family protein [Diaminobutyricibacter tongyongensis]NEN07499.1 glyoxalase [Diaminobutyricibacter tongyongensis]